MQYPNKILFSTVFSNIRNLCMTEPKKNNNKISNCIAIKVLKISYIKIIFLFLFN